jgi:hypothetical protein
MKVVANIQINLNAKFHIFLWSLSISTILFPHADVFQIGKGIIYWKKNHGPLFTAPAQHCDDPGPIQCAKLARTVCFLGTLLSGPNAS